MLDNIGIRTKVLGVVVATATVGTVAAASLNTVGSTAAVAQVSQQVAGLRPLTDALRRERDASMGVLAQPGDREAERALVNARILTSTLLSTTDAGLDDVDASQLAPSARSALRETRQQRSAVLRVRDGVDDGTLPAVSVRGGYDQAAQQLGALPGAVGQTQDDRDLSLALTTWTQGQDVVTLTEEQRTLVAGAVADGSLDPVEAQSLYASAVRRDTLRAVFAQRAATDGVAVPSTAPELRAVRDQLLRAASAGQDDPAGAGGFTVDPAVVSAATSAELGVLGRAEGALATRAQERSTALAQDARSAVLTRVLVAAGLALLLVGLALLVVNSIVRRLRRVTAAAETLRRDLPAAVEAASSPGASVPTGVASVGEVAGRSYGRDEVGRLARALDETGALALDLAAGQARLRSSVSQAFVSVARRNQSLLDRQLAAIDSLERDETDSTALSTLFELDHTTARMRRNAESLLVIAGAEGGRRSREPMSLVDVVRTGASGVEHYARVEVSLDVDPQVLPHAALSLAHLVAELLENATAFSGPSAPVEVRSRQVGAGVVLTVTDHGLGLSPADLARARALLGGVADASAADASRLGLTVVARLSRRLGAGVELDSSVAGGDGARGTTATVRVPASLLVAGRPTAAPVAQGGSAVVVSAATAAPGAAAPAPAAVAVAPATAGDAVGDAVGVGHARHRVERRARWFAKARHATVRADDASDDATREALEVVSWTPPAQDRPDRSRPAEDGGSLAGTPAGEPSGVPVGAAPHGPRGAVAPWASREHPARPAPTTAPYQPARRTADADAPVRAQGTALPRRTAGERYRSATSGQMLTPPPRAPRAGDADRGPEQVRSTLAGFRAGVARARAEAPTAGPASTDVGHGAGRDGSDGADAGSVDAERQEPAEAGRR